MSLKIRQRTNATCLPTTTTATTTNTTTTQDARTVESKNRLVYDLKKNSMTALALAWDSDDGGADSRDSRAEVSSGDVDLPPSMVVESRTMPVVSLGKGT